MPSPRKSHEGRSRGSSTPRIFSRESVGFWEWLRAEVALRSTEIQEEDKQDDNSPNAPPKSTK